MSTPKEQIEKLIRQIRALEVDMLCAENADNFYYSSGRHARHKEALSTLHRELATLSADGPITRDAICDLCGEGYSTSLTPYQDVCGPCVDKVIDDLAKNNPLLSA